MTLEQYFSVLIKQWKLIIICFVLVGLGTYIGSRFTTRLYQSSALVQVAIRSSNNLADINSLLASDQLVQTEASLAVSTSVLGEVASRHPGLTAGQLAGEATSTPRLNTQLFEIDVVDPSPTRAADLANDIATTLIKQQLQVIQQDNSQSQQQIQQDLDLTRQQIDTITSKISILQAKGGNQVQIPILQTQLGGLQQHYNQWETLLAQLELTEAQSGNFLRVAQTAQPSLSPIRPNVLLNTAAGLLMGLLLGVLLAMLYERLDTRIRTPEVLSQLVNWPVLGTVWHAKSSKKEDVINPSNHDPNIESYRILRTNIGFASIDKPLHSLVITSAMPRDGKSMIAANLAIFMARAGKQTLLIDADLHRPTQHRLFNLPGDRMGLSNALLAFGLPGLSKSRTPSDLQFQNPALQALNSTTTDNLSLGPFVHPVGIPNLWVMPSGPLPPNPAELLDSKAMERFLVVIANCGVEVAIFDTPPLLGLSDASILASKVDGALAVIDMTRATKGKLEHLKAALAKTGVNVLGCVANKHRRSRNDSAYSYYYYQMDEQKGSEEQGGIDETTWHTGLQVPGAPLSPVSPSPYEQGKKSN